MAETLRDHPRPGSNSLGAIALQTDATPKGQHGVAYTLKLPSKSGGGQPPAVAHPLTASGGSSRSYVAASMAARRLTPRECERLQGFPDDYTQIPYRGKPASECPDGPRYRALGNSMAVNVMRWLGERIQRADSIQAVGRGE